MIICFAQYDLSVAKKIVVTLRVFARQNFYSGRGHRGTVGSPRFYYVFIIMENTANSLSLTNNVGSDSVLSNPMSLLSDDISLGDSGSSTDSSWGFWSILGAILLVIIVLAIAGLNIFSYLAEGTEKTANWFEYLAGTVKQYTGQIPISQGLGNVVGVSALGTRDIVDATSKNINAVSTAIDNATERVLDPIIEKTATLKGTPLSQTTPSATNNTENNSLNRALNTQQALESGGAGGPKGSNYNADDSMSSIQKTGGKAGWCFIGDDNGTRTCARVGENQMCMSGDIFPTSEICVNPSLRA